MPREHIFIHNNSSASTVFQFWLEIFHLIMPHVDMLYNQLQKRTIDPVSAQTAVTYFENAMKTIRDRIDIVASQPEYQIGTEKRRKEDTRVTRNVAAKEICDVIINQIKERFSFIGHIAISNLYTSENFAKFNHVFPESCLRESCDAYPFVDKTRLKTELEVIYMREDFRNVSGAVDLLTFLIENNVQQTFSETCKLLKILVTVPMTTCEAERCFSTLNRVKTFLRSTMLEKRLSALAMLSIEKELVRNMSSFNERVIDKFAEKKDRRMNFIYRHFM